MESGPVRARTESRCRGERSGERPENTGLPWPVSGGFSGVERNEVKATSKRLEIVSGCETEWSGATLKCRSQGDSRVGSLRLSAGLKIKGNGAEKSQSADDLLDGEFVRSHNGGKRGGVRGRVRGLVSGMVTCEDLNAALLDLGDAGYQRRVFRGNVFTGKHIR